MSVFVAIDFETADAKRDSACAVGLVRVESGRVVYRESRRHKWRVIGSHNYAPAALALMDASGLTGGMWMLIDDGHDPNTKPEASIP